MTVIFCGPPIIKRLTTSCRFLSFTLSSALISSSSFQFGFLSILYKCPSLCQRWLFLPHRASHLCSFFSLSLPLSLPHSRSLCLSDLSCIHADWAWLRCTLNVTLGMLIRPSLRSLGLCCLLCECPAGSLIAQQWVIRLTWRFVPDYCYWPLWNWLNCSNFKL